MNTTEIFLPVPLVKILESGGGFQWNDESPVIFRMVQSSSVREKFAGSSESREWGEMTVIENVEKSQLPIVSIRTTKFPKRFRMSADVRCEMIRNGKFLGFDFNAHVQVRVLINADTSAVRRTRKNLETSMFPSQVTNARHYVQCNRNVCLQIEKCFLSCLDRRKEMLLMCRTHLLKAANPKKFPTVEEIISGSRGLKFLQSKVQGLCYGNLDAHKKAAYVSPKLDGQRVFVIITNQMEVLSSTSIENRGPVSLKKTPVILDGEMMDDGRIFVFDALFEGKRCLASSPYSTRLARFRDIVRKLPNELRCLEKPIITVEEARMSQDVYCGFRKQSDGLVFTPNENAFTMAIKWKCMRDNTIDFYVKQHSSNSFILNVSRIPRKGSDGKPCPVIMRPPDIEARSMTVQDSRLRDNCVGEFYWNDGWKLLRIREDKQPEVDGGKYFGNSEFVAMVTWFSIHHPISEHFAINEIPLAVGTKEISDPQENFHRGVQSIGISPGKNIIADFYKTLLALRPQVVVIYLEGSHEPKNNMVTGYLKTWYTTQFMRFRNPRKNTLFIRDVKPCKGDPCGPKQLEMAFVCAGSSTPKDVCSLNVKFLV